MDMDTLFTVVFVVVIILFQLFGTVVSRLAKRDQDEMSNKKAKASGLLHTLKNRVANEIQIAMQQASTARQTPGGRTGTIETPLRTRYVGDPAPEAYNEAEAPADEFTAIEEADLVDEIRHELLDESIEQTAETNPIEAMPVSDRVGYTRANLRRAVIWSEILAPPLALRD